MSLKDYLTTFELTNEREKRVLRTVEDGFSNLYDSTRQLYHRTPAIVKAGALVGLGALGTLAYQKATEPAELEKKVFVSYHNGGSGDAKDVPYDYSGYVTVEQYKRIREDHCNKINHVDIEFGGW